ncbi:MAG: hypothetical protein JO319_03055 [Acidobacteriaceae bacterium]|nr:hypothetical protein [Acidobacteriaceae bacterium]
MRTTLDLDEDILRLLKHLAQDRRQSLGRVVSDVVRQSLVTARSVARKHGKIPVLPRKPGAQPVTAQRVKDLLELDA